MRRSTSVDRRRRPRAVLGPALGSQQCLCGGNPEKMVLVEWNASPNGCHATDSAIFVPSERGVRGNECDVWRA
jgi:hypothetical protein